MCSSFDVDIKDLTNGVSNIDDLPEHIIEIKNEETQFKIFQKTKRIAE